MPVCRATLHDGQGEEVQLVTCHRTQLVYSASICYAPIRYLTMAKLLNKTWAEFSTLDNVVCTASTFHAVSINTARLRVENSVQTNFCLSPK
jgi:hypothetical protein